MRLRRTDHTGFTVANLDRSISFYRDVLGLSLISQQVGTAEYLSTVTGFPGVQIKLAFLQVDGDDHILELLEYVSHPGETTPRDTNRPGNGHLCFVVDDVVACYEELRVKGVHFVSSPVEITAGVHRGAKVVYLRDPDGFTLEFSQAPPSP